MNNNQLFITAVKDGNYISIAAFKPKDGMKCGCICPDCGRPVQSNISSKDPWELKRNFTNHFSHIDENTTCKGGYKETQLHLLAKSILEQARSLNVPSSPFHFSDKIEYANVAVEPAFPVDKYKQYRPDIILTTASDEKIAVEIFVTNDVSFAKRQLYRENKLKCLKIDLSEFIELDLEEFRSEIEDQVLKETSGKIWLSPVNIEVKNKTNPLAQSEGSGCLLTLFLALSMLLFTMSFLCFILLL